MAVVGGIQRERERKNRNKKENAWQESGRESQLSRTKRILPKRERERESLHAKIVLREKESRSNAILNRHLKPPLQNNTLTTLYGAHNLEFIYWTKRRERERGT
jgi:hypothetical protein